ncbi:PREDICTED: protein ATAF2-like [Fragaria vesca subsp. vesca]|uniref:protein ATAF2-like n=1 Tax=Fragaria vesca subsp. vesca TaxID=101020 RepID=UPI0002C32219|nr:PREDICTED: protein ATAF2-like [Fragaria vesca subsp. vesca]XP_011468878.1 PREDICTED: protein ATAF2-like [Fragaria vesca subsp. vesca]
MSSGGFTAPKGYRYNPSDEELFSDLEQKNHCKDSQITTIIPDIDDVCKYEPRQLPELAFTRAENLVGKFFFFFFFWIIREESWHSQRKWYFFTRLDYKYTNSSRVNRTTGEGYWKITGKDRAIKAPDSKAVIGRKRTLTFYKRGVLKAQKNSQKTGWVIHEYFLIQESCDPPKQIGEYVVCCLKYKSDNSDHDKDAPFCNRGSSSCSMAFNVENQAEENWLSEDLLNVVPIPNGNESETVGGMITEEEEYLALKELEDALQVPIGNPHEFEGMQTDPCCIEQNDHSTSVEGRPDSSNSSDMIDELLDDPENLDSLFDPPAPRQLDQLHQSPMYTTDVHKHECRKRPYSFEHDDPSLPKKNNISTDDGNNVSNNASNSESQATNVIPKEYSQPGANVGSDFDLFLPKDYVCTQPSINGGPRDFSNDNNYIELDDLLSFYQGIDSSLAEFSDIVIDGGRGVTSDRNTSVVHGSENDYSALASGASLHHS